MPGADAADQAHYQRQAATARMAAATAGRDFARILDPADPLGSWRTMAPHLLSLVTAAQTEAATTSAAYLPALLAAYGVASEAEGAIVPSALAGVASDGRDLFGLLFQPVALFRRMLGDGAAIEDAEGRAMRQLMMLVRTQVADTGRAATGIGITTEKAIAGYERVVRAPACARCLALAGRVYTWSAGFKRHPNCDCVNVPITRAQLHQPDTRNTPQHLFDQMTPAQQTKAFGEAGAKAIRNGADIAQVVNARRGMYTAGGRSLTREATTRRGIAGRRLGARRGAPAPIRLTPEQIYAEAANDRDQAISLLRRFGYIT